MVESSLDILLLIQVIANGSFQDSLRLYAVNIILKLVFCSKAGAILYKAQSQDEEALVHAAAQLHMVLVNKNASILGKSLLLLTVRKRMKLLVEMMK